MNYHIYQDYRFCLIQLHDFLDRHDAIHLFMRESSLRINLFAELGYENMVGLSFCQNLNVYYVLSEIFLYDIRMPHCDGW